MYLINKVKKKSQLAMREKKQLMKKKQIEFLKF